MRIFDISSQSVIGHERAPIFFDHQVPAKKADDVKEIEI